MLIVVSPLLHSLMADWIAKPYRSLSPIAKRMSCSVGVVLIGFVFAWGVGDGLAACTAVVVDMMRALMMDSLTFLTIAYKYDISTYKHISTQFNRYS